MLKCLENQVSFILHESVGLALMQLHFHSATQLHILTVFILKVVFYTFVMLQPIISSLPKAAWRSSSTFFPCVVCSLCKVSGLFCLHCSCNFIGIQGSCVCLQFTPALILMARYFYFWMILLCENGIKQSKDVGWSDAGIDRCRESWRITPTPCSSSNHLRFVNAKFCICFSSGRWKTLVWQKVGKEKHIPVECGPIEIENNICDSYYGNMVNVFSFITSSLNFLCSHTFQL